MGKGTIEPRRITMDSTSAAMAQFRDVKHPYPGLWWKTIATLVAFLLPGLPAFILWKVHPEWSIGSPGAAIALPTMAAMALCAWFAARKFDAGQLRWLAGRDAAALGETPNIDRYVGVSYINGMARLLTNWAWDRGFLSIRDGLLVFHGFASSFELPLYLVESVTLPWKAYIGRPLPVVLEWRHPDDKNEWIVFHVFCDASGKAVTERARDLAEWIEQAPVDEVVGEPVFPFRSTIAEGAIYLDENAVALPDRILALGCAGITLIACTSAMVFVAAFSSSGRYPGALGVMGFLASAVVYHLVVGRAYRRRRAKSDAPPSPDS